MSTKQTTQSLAARVYAMTEAEISALPQSGYDSLAKTLADEVRLGGEAQRWLYAVRELDAQKAKRAAREDGSE